MDDYKEVLDELRDGLSKCNELFNIAYDLNNDENTRTAFSQKTTTYMPDVIQTLSFLIGEFEREEIEEQILDDASKLEADYDIDIEDIQTIRNCSTCKNNVEFPPPHTCDICTSLDQEERYEMWESVLLVIDQIRCMVMTFIINNGWN